MYLANQSVRMSHLEGAEQALINTHHGAGIVKLAAVVGRRKEGDQLAFAEKLVAVLDYLMSTANEVHVVLL